MRPIRPSLIRSIPVFLALCVPAGDVSAGRPKSPEPSPLEVAVKKWAAKHRGKKAAVALEGIVVRVAEEVPEFRAGGDDEDVRLAGLRRIAAALVWPDPPRETQRFKARNAKGKGPSGPRPFPLPKEVVYRFGFRELMGIDEKNRALNAALKKERVPTADLLEETVRLEALLEGTSPEAELAIAEIQRRLDIDPTADLYARFLETWRNWGPHGEESFYEALDRTAGTSEEVFFYDAMLGDFVSNFAPEVGKRWVLNMQHDRNQQAFLAYRQYRGLVEAVSFALVTPPDVALPARLGRYDYGSVAEGLFSLRHQIDLLVECAEGDVERVVADLKTFLEKHPMPADLWTGYDPMTALRDEFRRVLDRRIVGTGRAAEDLFRQQRDARTALAERIRAATERAIGG
ncbi:MAG: hypothetical protein ACF8XB_23720 [Planctomycetota bacterium JB042]